MRTADRFDEAGSDNDEASQLIRSLIHRLGPLLSPAEQPAVQ
jgi:hypothetical protein